MANQLYCVTSPIEDGLVLAFLQSGMDVQWINPYEGHYESYEWQFEQSDLDLVSEMFQGLNIKFLKVQVEDYDSKDRSKS